MKSSRRVKIVSSDWSGDGLRDLRKDVRVLRDDAEDLRSSSSVAKDGRE